jgi:hypothetical protein
MIGRRHRQVWVWRLEANKPAVVPGPVAAHGRQPDHLHSAQTLRAPGCSTSTGTAPPDPAKPARWEARRAQDRQPAAAFRPLGRQRDPLTHQDVTLKRASGLRSHADRRYSPIDPYCCPRCDGRLRIPHDSSTPTCQRQAAGSTATMQPIRVTARPRETCQSAPVHQDTGRWPHADARPRHRTERARAPFGNGCTVPLYFSAVQQLPS